MIQYDVVVDKLEAMVEEHKPGWTARAEARTKTFCKKGMYEEDSSIWGEIKAVFMRVQEFKCCFCERKLEGDFSQYELDLEHFRPKRTVRRWRCPPDLTAEGISLTVPPAKNNGYYLLSYHLLNYAAACKPCNSGLKKNFFPILGKYNFGGTDPRKLDTEQSWLLFPIGSVDIDPEDVISFSGILPQSLSDDPILRLRGLATIVFFGLDDVVARKNLMRERAEVIVLLHYWLAKAEDQEDIDAVAHVERMVASAAQHANCARDFKRLFNSDRPQARKVADDVERFLLSIS